MSNGAEDSGPSLVEVGFAGDSTSADHVTADLVNSFNRGVGLRISCGDEFHGDAIVILEHGEYFPFEFVASIQDYLCRPWVV